MRAVRFAGVVILLGLAACAPKPRPTVASVPPAAPAAPSAPVLEPVYGDWEADQTTPLRAAPSAGAAVVATARAGQPLKLVGRARGTDWVAVSQGGGTAYVRLHLLRLRGTRTVTGTTTVAPKPSDNGGPAVKAAPRRRIDAAPLAEPTPLPPPT